MSQTNILLGSLLCAFAGACVGSFLLPLKFSRTWKWENSWLIGAAFMYVLFPLLTLRLLVPQFSAIYAETPAKDIAMIFVFGLIQGTGAYVFTYGTTVLGLALGYALMIGAISVVSLLVPLFGAHRDRLRDLDGITLLAGCAVLVAGIFLSGKAGYRREAGEADAKEKKQHAINWPKAALIVAWAGIANSLFYFTFEFQQSMRAVAVKKYGVPDQFWGFLNILPFMLGMFAVNLVMTMVKMTKDGSLSNYWRAAGLAREYALAFSIGLLWYLGQGVAYTAGHTLLGPLGVAVGAALFMGTMMVVSSLAGLRTGEWEGVSRGTRRLLYSGLAVLVAAMTIVAIGNYLQQQMADAAG